MSIANIWKPKQGTVEIVAGHKGLASEWNAIVADLERIMPPPIMFSFSDRTLGSAPTGTHYGGYTDNRNRLLYTTSNVAIMAYIDMDSGGDVQSRTITDDWASAIRSLGSAVIGDYVYISMDKAAGGVENRVYRYDRTNLSAGGTIMTFSVGEELGTTAACFVYTDGEFFYFNNDGGDEATALHKFKKYSFSGTAFTLVGSIVCGITSADFGLVALDSLGNFYARVTGATLSSTLRRFTNAGVLSKESSANYTISAARSGGSFYCIEGVPYRYTFSSADYEMGFLRLPLLP